MSRRPGSTSRSPLSFSMKQITDLFAKGRNDPLSLGHLVLLQIVDLFSEGGLPGLFCSLNVLT